MGSVSEILIATTSNGSVLRESLNREMFALCQEGLAVRIDEWKTGTQTFVSCRCADIDDWTHEVFIYYAARALTGAILSQIEIDWIPRQLRQLHRDLGPKNLEGAVDRIRSLLTQASGTDWDLPHSQVLLEVMDYLEENASIHLEGFRRFRLKAYHRHIQEEIGKALAEWNAEQEQQEFLELLRYFMAVQESRLDQVDVVLRRNGSFLLLDETHNVIDDEYLEGFVADLSQGSVDHGDLLVSALLTLAPRHIRCHYEIELPVLNTLKGVFTDGITFCDGCDNCGNRNRHRKRSLPRK